VLGHKIEDREVPTSIYVHSNMEGLKINLPEPFKKTPERIAYTTSIIRFLNDSVQIETQYSNQITSIFDIKTLGGNTRLHRGVVNFSTSQTHYPEKEALVIEGVLNQVDIDEWRSAFANEKSASLDKPPIDIPVVLDMSYVRLVLPAEEKSNKKLAKPPVEKKSNPVKPSALPAIRGEIQQLIIGKAELGQLEIDMSHNARGMQLSRLDVRSPNFEFTSGGQWSERFGRQTSTLKGRLNAKNLGGLLTQMGYAAIVKKGEGSADFDFSWSKGLPEFDMGILDGSVAVNMKDGSIVDIDPGAGRLLGLLSLAALPKRLFFDFGELGSGLDFDKITGQFKFQNGNADTRDLTLESSLATAYMKGETSFAKKDFDMEVVVIPKISGTLPLTGYLAGGGQLGAILWMFQQAFGKDIDETQMRIYSITGSWEKPVIEQTNKPAKEKE